MIRVSFRSAILLLGFAASAVRAQEFPEYYTLERRAEAAFDAGRIDDALRAYHEIELLPLSPPAARWVKFRVLDLQWRRSWEKDPVAAEAALNTLSTLTLSAKHYRTDRVSAEIEESLADYAWTRSAKDARWERALEHYSRALDWWYQNTANPQASARYTEIINKMALPSWRAKSYTYAAYGNWIPQEILSRGVEIARTPKEEGTLRYLLAKTLSLSALDEETRLNAEKNFRRALQLGKESGWGEAAQFDYAQFLEKSDLLGSDASGLSGRVKALEIYKRLADGKSAYAARAGELARLITKPSLRIEIGDFTTFEPEKFRAIWANQSQIGFSLSSFNLLSHLDLNSTDALRTNWHRGAPDWTRFLTGGTEIRRWSTPVGSANDLSATSKTFELLPPLPKGAYLLRTISPGELRENFFLVSDLFLTVNIVGKTARVFAASLRTGASMPEVRIRVWEKHRYGLEGTVDRHDSLTSLEGIAVVPLSKSPPSDYDMLFDSERGTERYQTFQLLAVGSKDGNEGYARDPQSFLVADDMKEWSAYVFFDRPVYCAGDRVHWILLAKRADYIARDSDLVQAELVHPLGGKLPGKWQQLKEFGRADGSFRLSKKWRAGEYGLRMYYRNANGGERTPMGEGRFRIEEKPECRTIRTEEQNNPPK